LWEGVSPSQAHLSYHDRSVEGFADFIAFIVLNPTFHTDQREQHFCLSPADPIGERRKAILYGSRDLLDDTPLEQPHASLGIGGADRISWDLGSLLVVVGGMTVSEVQGFSFSVLLVEIATVFGP